jgi:mRNA interferase MazF
MTPRRGEVWLFDLGMAEKVRPALVVSVDYGDLDRALITIVPHTTSLRGSQYEISVNIPFLKPGGFLVQNVSTYPNIRAIRKLGALKPVQFDLVFTGVLRWLGHTPA